MIKDVFGDQLAESFKPEIVEQFNPWGYSVNRTKWVKDREKFINLFDNDFNI